MPDSKASPLLFPSEGRPPSHKREKTQLNAVLERDLLLYAAAAGAACTGILVSAPETQAEIVYTPVHILIGAHHKVALDLNHDGVTDFTISNHAFCTTDICGRTLLALPAGNNKVAGAKSVFIIDMAYALKAGSEIGPKLQFVGKLMAASGTEYGSGGNWFNVTNRYLGFKLTVNGESHYGWARLNVAAGTGKIQAVLTGYAYETVANKPIIAGKTKGPEAEAASSPANVPAAQPMLGMLAMGAQALTLWRRD